ncbi:hypothetical protein BRADI_3g14784v3, partial [Brachypodium distachyon]
TRPWCGLTLPYDVVDRDLFRAWTRIHLGDGAKTQFWHDAWLPDGSIPRLRWPGLFAIATRKHRSVQKELSSANWIRSLLRISTPAKLDDFVQLWDCLQTIHLSSESDRISWKWTPSGIYSAASAYRAQFHDSFPTFSVAKIWKAQTEPKCRFFAWTLLCRTHPETILHICRDCSFSSEVFGFIHAWSQHTPMVDITSRSVNDHWDAHIFGISKKEKRMMSGRLIYSWWGIWKERNRRIFRGAALTALEVAHLIWEAIQCRSRACSTDLRD